MGLGFLGLYLTWAAIVGSIFIIAILVVTTTPVSRIISRRLRRGPPDADL